MIFMQRALSVTLELKKQRIRVLRKRRPALLTGKKNVALDQPAIPFD